MTMRDNKSSDFRSMVVSMLTGFAGSKNVISIPHVFFKWTNRNHPLAIFFSQALYWHGKTDHPEKWFARTLEEWDEETGLGRAQLERAAVILEQVGLKREVKRSMWHGFVPVVHYRFDEDKLFEAARAFFEDGKTLSMKSTKDSRQKLKEDNASRAEKRKGHLNATSKPDLNATSKRQSNFTRKREMNATSDSYIKTSRDQEETTEKITTTAPAIANAGPILSPNEKDVSYPFVEQRLSSLPINGKSESSAPAENRKQGKAKATTTPTPSPLPAPVAEVQEFAAKLDAAKGTKGKGKTGFTREELNAMAVTLGDALGVPPVGKDFAVYGNVACDLLKATIPVEEFAAHVKFCKEESGGRYTITVTSLTSGGRPSRYVASRDKKAIEAQKQKELEEQIYARYPQLRPRETSEPVEYMPADEVQRMMDMVLNPPTRQENAS